MYKPEFSEDQRGMIQAVLTMPPVVRHEFYKSVEGQEFLKGIEMVAENDKTRAEALGDKREWTREDIEEMVNRIRTASPEDREMLLQIIPGTVIGIIQNRMNAPENRIEQANVPDEFKKSIKKIIKKKAFKKKVKKLIEKGIRGPVKGTPGYFQWLERLRASRSAKAAITSAAKKSPVTLGSGSAKPTAKKEDKTKKHNPENEKADNSGKKDYKHFVRKIGEKAEISDKPVGKKE